MNVILVAPPRSGAGLLQAVLATDPAWRPSRLSAGHAIDELAGFSAAERGFSSHRLTASDADAAVVEALRAASDGETTVTVDWHPRLSMRIGLLAEALPDSRFVLVARRPVPAMASLMTAWSSRRFASLPDLPGWWGEPWAFPLVEGWRDLIGRPPAAVCAGQWAGIASAVMEDLAELPSDRWTVASYEGLLVDPAAEAGLVASALGLDWSGSIPDPLPVMASAVTRPDPGSWRRNWPELSVALPAVQPTVERYREFVQSARPGVPWPELELPEPSASTLRTVASEGTPFSSSHTATVPSVLEQAGASLVITTYKSGHLILGRNDAGRLNTEFTALNRPMGVAVAGSRLAVGVADAVLAYSANPGVAPRVPSPRPVDVAYVPRSVVYTGDIAIHDMSYAADGQLYFVNTRFSCLCRQDIDHSFVPVWRPAWISGLAAEDRCHLNGLCVVDGVPRFVTALAQTDVAHGWRELKGTSGVIVDVTTDRIVTSGLSMPHSPRWHDGRLWVLESGKGSLATVDVDTGEVTTVATLPGFTRGLAFAGPFAFVGLSQVRESVFSSLPITEQASERNCGVWMVDTRTGDIAGFVKFDGVVQEIFDVRLLPARWPALVAQGELTQSAFVLPDEALRDVVQGPRVD